MELPSDWKAAPSDAIVLRWVPDHKVNERPPGRQYANSDAFRPSSDGTGTSVIIVTTEDEVAAAIERNSDYRYWLRLPAGEVLTRDLLLGWTRTERTDDPQHGSILGWPERRKDRQGIEVELRDRSVGVPGSAPPPNPAH